MVKRRPFDANTLAYVEERHNRWRSLNGGNLSKRYVPGEGCETGEPDCVAFIIGEAPGAHEDLKLRPFVGESGLVLRELMASAGLFTGYTPHFGTANCWLTNVVKFRPPGNATPDAAMIEEVSWLLRDEWTAVGMPQVIIPVGNVALQAVLGYKASILRMSGTLYKMESVHAQPQVHSVWPMIHPSFAIHQEGKQGERMRIMLEKEWSTLGTWLKEMGYTR